MKRVVKVITRLLIVALLVEAVLLTKEAISYKQNKFSSWNINGRIVAEIDNIINFSGIQN